METTSLSENRAEYSVNVIPDALYKYLTKKGIGAGYLMMDVVLDERLTTEDLAQLFYLNGYDFGGKLNEGRGRDMCLGRSSIVDEIARYKMSNKEALNSKITTALSWSFSTKIAEEVTRSLSGKIYDAMETIPQCVNEDSVYSEANPPYEFIVTGPKIWLTVKSGFLTMLKNPILRHQFYRSYNAALGKIVPLQEVVSTTVYARYVEELVG